MARLDGKVALVTGGASGIGRASAIAMAAHGASVAVADINAEKAREVAAEIVSGGYAAEAIDVDLSDEGQVEEMVRATAARFGGIDVLFNNAANVGGQAMTGDTDVVNLDLATWDRTMSVNVRGPMLGCRFAIPFMVARGGGSIINTSSAAADVGDVSRCAYGTSKGAINSLTRYVAAAFGKAGIRCNAIAPGIVDTPALRSAWSARAGADATVGGNIPEDVLDNHMSTRISAPEDIAALAVFLASDDSAQITGQIVKIDGGFFGHSPYYARDVRSRLAQAPT